MDNRTAWPRWTTASAAQQAHAPPMSNGKVCELPNILRSARFLLETIITYPHNCVNLFANDDVVLNPSKENTESFARKPSLHCQFAGRAAPRWARRTVDHLLYTLGQVRDSHQKCDVLRKLLA